MKLSSWMKFSWLFQTQVTAHECGVTFLAMWSKKAEEASGRKSPVAL